MPPERLFKPRLEALKPAVKPSVLELRSDRMEY